MLRTLFLLLCIQLFALTAAQAESHDYVLERAYFEDPSNRLSFAEVQNKAYTPYTGLLSKGYSTSTFWVRLKIAPVNDLQDEALKKLVLRIQPTYLDEIELFDPLANTNQPRVVGDRYPFDNNEYQSLTFNFMVPSHQEARHVWLRLKTTSTTINAGTLSLGANNVLADTGAVNVSGGTFNIASFNDTVGTVTLSSGTITGTTGQLTSANYNVTNTTGTSNISAILAGNGQLTKTGAGSLTLSGANTYTGDTNISAGTLILTGSLSSSTDVVMTNAAIWDLQAAQIVSSLSMAAGNTITNTAGTSSLVVTGTSTLANSITTSGTQTYTGAVTLAANTAINTTDSAVLFSAGVTGSGNTLTVNAGSGAISTAALGTSAASLGAVILNSTGATTLGGATYAASVTTNVGGTVAINTGTVTTTGAQTYNDAVTLGQATTLTGTTINTASTVAGNNHNLTITGDADIDGVVSNVNNIAISGTANLGANVTTNGTQTYTGAVTVSGANRTLTGSTVNTASSVDGGGFNLTLSTDRFVAGGNIQNVRSLTVIGDSALSGNVNTSGVQTYIGALTFAGGNRDLSATLVVAQSTVDGGGFNLTITGNADIGGAVSNVNNLAISGTANLGADITTSGTQTYTGAVTISGTHRTLTGNTINTASTLNGGGYNLTITGNADIDGAVNNVNNLAISGTANLGADITTSGTQTYTGAVTVSGANRTLTGSTINTASTVDGGGFNLTITGNADIDGAVTNVANLSVSGSSNIAANITTSGAQTYSSAMVLSNDITFTMGAASTASGEISGAFNLTKAGAGSLTLSGANTYTGDTNISAGILILTGSLSSLTDVVMTNADGLMTNAAEWNLQVAQTVASLSMAPGNSIINTAGSSSLVVTGISEVAGTITTAGDQNYKGEVLLIGSSKFKSDNGRINFDGLITSNKSNNQELNNDLEINPKDIDLDIDAETQVTFNGRVGAASSELYLFRLSSNPYNLSVKASEINIFADITTGKSQKYTGDIVVGSNANNGSTRTLLSLNPSVEITGKVDDLNSNTHTLIIKAVASPVVEGAPLPRPKITIDGPVGSVKPLYALEAITGFQVIRRQDGSAANLAIAGEVDVAGTIKDAFKMIGEIEIRDSVTTQQDQTYLANQIRIGGGIAKLVLTTEDGVINILSGKNFINQDLSGGVKADDGTQIAIKGKFSRETANSFRESGVRYESDPVGGYVDAALANVQSKAMDKIFIEREARVVVGAALKIKDGKISSFDESTGDSKSNASETLTTNCMKDISQECQK